MARPVVTRGRTALFLAAATALVAGASGCGGGNGDRRPERAHTSGSCADVIAWNGHRYHGSGVRVPASLGERLGVGRPVRCGDRNGATTASPVPLAAIAGVEPEVAVARAGDPLHVYVARGSRARPAALARILSGPPCAAPAPFVVEGPWVGESNPGDPHVVQIEVDETSRADYLGVVLDLAVDSREAVVRARPRPGSNSRLRARVRCGDGRGSKRSFAAEHITVAGRSPDFGNAPLCGPAAAEPPCGMGAILGRSYPYQLLTHCGVNHAYFDGRLWVVVGGPLDDGFANAPRGWDNPTQRGLMRLLTSERADFRVPDRLSVVFVPAPPSFRPQACD